MGELFLAQGPGNEVDLVQGRDDKVNVIHSSKNEMDLPHGLDDTAPDFSGCHMPGSNGIGSGNGAGDREIGIGLNGAVSEICILKYMDEMFDDRW